MRQHVAPTTLTPTSTPKISPKGNHERRRSTLPNTNHLIISPDVRKKKVRPTTHGGGGFGAGTAAVTTRENTKTKTNTNTNTKTEEKREFLLQRLEESNGLVRALKEEVLGLKKKMEDLEVRNIVLETQNRMTGEDLVAAQTKILMLESLNMKKESEFRDSKNRIDVVDVEISEKQSLNSPVKSPNPSRIAMGSPPPPPPPPPPRHTCTKMSAMQKETPSLVEFYHSLTKRDRKANSPSGLANCTTSVVNKAHSNIVGEIQNRSSHLLAIKADVETKGEFINSLITKVHTMMFTGIEDLLDFVEWLDKELSTLADERAVLKHFNWPEQKADAMREAAFEYRALKRVHDEVSLFEDDKSLTFEVCLKKMENLLNKSERSIQRLSKLRDGTMACYRWHKIPTNWMFDSGIMRKIKLGTMKLAKICMNRVPFDSQESLLLHCIRFSYRVHQFTGGLDVETMSAFEDLRTRIHPTESQKLLPRIIPF